MDSKIMVVTVSDNASYGFDPKEWTEEQAKQAAWDWFNERKPDFSVTYVDGDADDF